VIIATAIIGIVVFEFELQRLSPAQLADWMATKDHCGTAR